MLCLVTGACLLVPLTGCGGGPHSIGCEIRSSCALGVTVSRAATYHSRAERPFLSFQHCWRGDLKTTDTWGSEHA
eukprot:scaffold2549_cov57-Phaeocystis_antarctica.AAC.5